MTGEGWSLVEESWDPDRAGYHETVLTVGNGRLGTRGSLEEGHEGALPGTFLAGVYDAADAQGTDLVSCPDWLSTEVYVDDVRLDVHSQRVLSHRRVLDLATGVLHRETVVADEEGRRARLRTERLASMAERDLVALRIEVTPLGREAVVRVRTGVDAARRNLEAQPVYPPGTQFPAHRRWDKWSRSRHTEEVGRGVDGGVGHLTVRTLGSAVEIATALEVRTDHPCERRGVRHHEYVGEELTFRAAADTPVVVDKLVGYATSRDVVAGDPTRRAIAVVRGDGRTGRAFESVRAASTARWAELWDTSDCEIEGDPRAALALRFSIYHLLIAANPEDPTVNIGAKSLSGEGYRGHVFWDTEIMMLPFFLHTQPAAARALLGYRHHTLPGARQVSAEAGTAGARYPWESADTGREECPRFTPDGVSEFFTRDQEIHVSADVALGILGHAETTGETDFLFAEGAEIIFETSRFWLDRAEEVGDRLALRTVMGPDEFHSHVDDNAFTDVLAAWHLEQAALLHARMQREQPERLAALEHHLDLDPSEPAAWARGAARMTRPTVREDGVVEQFAGYFDRDDVGIREWDDNDMPLYPPGHHHFNCETTMLLKQPDVVMLFFLFPSLYDVETQRATYAFYESRTLHKSSLSPSVHAIVGLRIGLDAMSARYFDRSAYVDLDDNQGNTAEGMHIASAGGTWQIVVRGYAGMSVAAGDAAGDGPASLRLAPRLPEDWRRVRFSVVRPEGVVRVDLGHDDHRLRLDGVPGTTATVVVHDEQVVLSAGGPEVVVRAAARATDRTLVDRLGSAG